MKLIWMYILIGMLLVLTIFCSACIGSVIDPYGNHKLNWDDIIPFTLWGVVLTLISSIAVFLKNKSEL